jgi:hypothetical protein
VDRRRLLQLIVLVIAMRAILGAWMWGTRLAFPTAQPQGNIASLYKDVPVEINSWLEPWQRWDTLHYQAIAARGYSAFDTALFTPPLYPLLMRWVGWLTGNTLLAGLIISGLFALLAILMMYRLALHELGNQADALRSALYLISFPAALFLFAAYTESIFLSAAIACLFAARRARWIEAGLWGGVVALARAPGILIIVPVFYSAWVSWRTERAWRPFSAVILIGVLAALFPLYAWGSGGFTPVDIIHAVGRGGYLTFPGLNLIEAARRIFSGQLPEENAMELFFALLFIVLTIFIWNKLPRVYGVYAATFMLLFLARMGTPQPLVSTARYVLEIFPAFIILAHWGRNPWINRLILYPSWIALLFFAGQFAMWGWVG